MIHIQTTAVGSKDKEYNAMLYFAGGNDYYIYNPYAEALRMLADYVEGIIK